MRKTIARKTVELTQGVKDEIILSADPDDNSLDFRVYQMMGDRTVNHIVEGKQ